MSMDTLFWNVRGLRNPGRRRQLKEVVKNNNIEIICLQETIRVNFKMREINCGGRNFDWLTKPINGHSGGLLLGIKTYLFNILDRDVVEFFISMMVESKKCMNKWTIINVYDQFKVKRKVAFY